MRSVTENLSVLHRAAWVIPVGSPPVQDGGVWVHSGRVTAVGRFRDLRTQCPCHTEVRDQGDCALMPALVNAHTHLELTGLQGFICLPQPSFARWLEELLPLRCGLSVEDQRTALEEGERCLFEEATALCADITNGATFSLSEGFPWVARKSFLEVIGFNQPGLESVMGWEHYKSSLEVPGTKTCGGLAAHACYSTAGAVIQEAKEVSRKGGLLFSIHVAEHEDEIEFLRRGTGFCRDLLESMGKWVSDWKPPGTTPVQYLDRLGVLDERTLLVHCVHLSRLDWEIIAARGCSVCFCPRSNRNLNVGEADIPEAVRWNIPWALGTDSLASNERLSLFAEACLAIESHLEVSPDVFLRAATLGGAESLHMQGEYGTIQPGSRAVLIAVSLPISIRETQLSETILYRGREGEYRWVHHPSAD